MRNIEVHHVRAPLRRSLTLGLRTGALGALCSCWDCWGLALCVVARFNGRVYSLTNRISIHIVGLHLSLIMAHSPSVPAAAAVAFSSARCQPVATESRFPCGARCWLYSALAIVLLSSACRVSTAQVTWSTAQLSVPRSSLAATSVRNVAIFAGGDGGNCIFASCDEGVCFGVVVRG